MLFCCSTSPSLHCLRYPPLCFLMVSGHNSALRALDWNEAPERCIRRTGKHLHPGDGLLHFCYFKVAQRTPRSGLDIFIGVPAVPARSAESTNTRQHQLHTLPKEAKVRDPFPLRAPPAHAVTQPNKHPDLCMGRPGRIEIPGEQAARARLACVRLVPSWKDCGLPY